MTIRTAICAIVDSVVHGYKAAKKADVKDLGRAAVADLRGPRPANTGFRPERSERRDFRPPRPEYPPLPLEIRVLPEQKALGAVIRRIQTSHRAFPLRDIAWLFLDNPASCLIRVEPLKDQQLPLFQCKVCGMPALSEEEIRAQLAKKKVPLPAASIRAVPSTTSIFAASAVCK